MSVIVKTQYSNLGKHKKTGVYYARIKLGGKTIERSLRTDKLSKAKRILPKTLEAIREKAGKKYDYGIYYAADAYVIESQANPNLAPRTKDYHREIVRLFKKTWNGPIEIEDITKKHFMAYLAVMFDNCAVSRVNAIQSLITWIGKWSLENDIIPSTKNFIELPRRTHRPKHLSLPTRQEFIDIERMLKARYHNHFSWTYWAVVVIARTGARLSELQAITWEDVDFIAKRTRIKTAKGRDREVRERLVPFIGGIDAIYKELKQELDLRGYSVQPTDSIIPIKWFNKALREAFTQLGKPELTPHDFRHLFATRCIESGVDIQTVSRWLGHEDGGALAMKTYVHLLDSHSSKMADKVEI